MFHKVNDPIEKCIISLPYYCECDRYVACFFDHYVSY